METTKNIVNAKVKESQGKKLNFTLGPGVVTKDKVHPNTYEFIQEMINKKGDDLQNQIDSIQMHGVAVSNEFGDDPYISVSQKTLTEALHQLYVILSDITGEPYEGFSMLVSPTYYIGEDGCTVTINAHTLAPVGKFERIAFYWNSEEEPFLNRTNVYGIDNYQVELPLDKFIDDQIIIRCEAKILGQPYIQQQAIKHYDSLWLGAGNSYQDIMIPANLIPAAHHMRGAYDVTAQDNDHIMLVIGDGLVSQFIRADMNGFEIPLIKSEDPVVIDDNAYWVFTSENTYNAGVYNIDING